MYKDAETSVHTHQHWAIDPARQKKQQEHREAGYRKAGKQTLLIVYELNSIHFYFLINERPLAPKGKARQRPD